MAKVMLVEDDANLRAIYGDRLMAEGFDIVAAKDGEEGLAMAVKERPDLIISDVMMPKISGFDMLDILRTTPETKDTKVIMMTALSQGEDKERADKLGADKYLVKSQVTLEDVARVVHEVLGDSSGVSAVAEQTPAPAPAAVATPLAGTPVQQPAATEPATPVTPTTQPDPTVATTPATQPAMTPTVAAAPEPSFNPITSPAPAYAPTNPTPATPSGSVLQSPTNPITTPTPAPEAAATQVVSPTTFSQSPMPSTPAAPAPQSNGMKTLQPVSENFGQPADPKIFELYEKEMANQAVASVPPVPAPTPQPTPAPTQNPIIQQPTPQPLAAAPSATPTQTPNPAPGQQFDPNAVTL